MKRILPICVFFSALVLLAFLLFRTSENTEYYGFDLGLDLAGGTSLTYEADISKIESRDVADAMSSLQAVLERRLNALGSSDIRVTTEQSSIFAQNSSQFHRVHVAIPGIFDSQEAQTLIGEIPVLEFRLGPDSRYGENFGFVPTYENTEETGIGGKHVKTASISSHANSFGATVDLTFNSEGGDMFFNLTRDHVGHYLVIFLDGQVISDPVIQTTIPGGVTTISGNFTFEEASLLARNLKFGALPVPIELASSQSVSPSLGQDIISKGTTALGISLLIIVCILIALYGIAGLVASGALALYTLLLLGYFKISGTDMTASGIAGLVITIGMAVDANVLIFERIREEIQNKQQTLHQAICQGFDRAWLSIRDGNISSLIVACVLYFLTTSFVKGFALAFGIGIIISMFTALVVTRSLLVSASVDIPTVRKFLVGYQNDK